MNLTRVAPRIAEILHTYQTPGAALGVLHASEVTTLVFGVADVISAEPVQTNTIFQCGSLTKTWTALAFMQLVDEGKVDLDAPVRRYLPAFTVADPDTTAGLTPRHLLQHTSGIEECYGDPGDDVDVYERMVHNIAGAPQVCPLGHSHGYSAALGYAILARIQEVVDDRRWDDAMTRRLFAPMGLTSTHSWRDAVDTSRTAKGHLIRSAAEGPIRTPIDNLPRSFGPGGNITSTAGEVLELANVFLARGVARNGSRILSADGIEQMQRSQVALPDPYTFGPAWREPSGRKPVDTTQVLPNR